MLSVPVLLIAFRRPDTTREVFESIRQAQPKRLYIAVDGPRPERPGEAELCEACRRIADDIDWACEVFTLFREKNRGCRRGVSEAINWFFEHESEGIILEDDCVPHPDFYRFADEMLSKYRYDPRVMAVTGDNFQYDMGDYRASYYFTIFNHVWGWATWKRAWDLYDTELNSFTPERAREVIDPIAPIPGFTEYWIDQIARTKSGHIDTWDYVWFWSFWLARGLTCIPRNNMVKNIGFGGEATHTFSAASADGFPVLEARGLEFPLIHPEDVLPDRKFDKVTAIRWRLTSGTTPDMKLSRRVLKPLKRRVKLLRSKMRNLFRRKNRYRFRQGWEKPTRTALLRHVAEVIDAKSYLEIGVRNTSDNFDHIPIANKIGVDPDPEAEASHIMTSDTFFENHPDLRFDLIFIDGDHTGAQVAKDIGNSLKVLNEGGYILLHDLNPATAFEARDDYLVDGVAYDWCGSSWQGFVKYRAERDDLEMFVVDTDYGCGVIRRGRQTPYKGAYGTYEDLAADRARMLNLISVEEFLQRV